MPFSQMELSSQMLRYDHVKFSHSHSLLLIIFFTKIEVTIGKYSSLNIFGKQMEGMG